MASDHSSEKCLKRRLGASTLSEASTLQKPQSGKWTYSSWQKWNAARKYATIKAFFKILAHALTMLYTAGIPVSTRWLACVGTNQKLMLASSGWTRSASENKIYFCIQRFVSLTFAFPFFTNCLFSTQRTAYEARKQLAHDLINMECNRAQLPHRLPTST